VFTGGVMAKVTITEAAKLAGISRQQLYRGYINKGRLSTEKAGDKSFIDVSELLRVFPNAKIETSESDTILHHDTPKNNQVTSSENEIVTILKTQLAEAKEREKWLTSQIDELRHQQTYLIEDKTPKKRKKFLGIF
jgi:DNA-binding transcriptional MerR regulator